MCRSPDRSASCYPLWKVPERRGNGVNWIKIGDADKGGKYIYKTKEKICPEEVTKSRMVHILLRIFLAAVCALPSDFYRHCAGSGTDLQLVLCHDPV